MIKELDPDYTIEVDTINKDLLHNYLRSFCDSNIYQTWSYESVRSNKENFSHLLLKKKGTVVSISQARIVKIPFLNIGIAYVRWGPVWKLQGENENIEIFTQTIRALRNEYVYNRKLVLRIAPIIFDENIEKYTELFHLEGYEFQKNYRRQKTLLIDLSASLEELRKVFEQKWRNCLNRAEKNNLMIISGENDDLFRKFIGIYNEMVHRKKFSSSTDLHHLMYVNRDLPDYMKCRVFICLENGIPSAGAICNAIGDTAIYLFGATNSVGMKNNGSYLIQWKILQWLKEKNVHWYNLHGIDRDYNPGTYRFKVGLSGRNGKECQYVGQWNCWDILLSAYVVTIGETALVYYRKLKYSSWRIFSTVYY